MKDAVLLWSPCDLCGAEFRQYVTDRPARPVCPGCVAIEQQQAAIDDCLHKMRG